jgi:hypothetical protein
MTAVMRMDSYLRSLNSFASFFEASDRVSAQDWATYVEELDIEKPLPGALPWDLCNRPTGQNCWT